MEKIIVEVLKLLTSLEKSFSSSSKEDIESLFDVKFSENGGNEYVDFYIAQTADHSVEVELRIRKQDLLKLLVVTSKESSGLTQSDIVALYPDLKLSAGPLENSTLTKEYDWGEVRFGFDAEGQLTAIALDSIGKTE